MNENLVENQATPTLVRPTDSENIALEAARAMIEKKAENIRILEIGEHSSFADFFVICSASSDRQSQTIANFVEEHLKHLGLRTLSREGYTEGRWILMDYGTVIVHVFLDALRDYYDLEGFWSQARNVAVPGDFYAPAASRLN